MAILSSLVIGEMILVSAEKPAAVPADVTTTVATRTP
ncbi:MAG: hypothetical protein JWO19_3879 [Bryobacterales bacterium]|jgi:hypothetical protein|nr:hypothetical protein [Bryobacterales bacterium]